MPPSANINDLRVGDLISLLLRLSIRSAHDRHKLLDLPALLGLVPGGYRVLDAVTHVVLEDLFLQPTQRRTRGSDLRDNVDAVAVILDHSA
jgi:hypothetical protein